jgi:hypothetical protein
LLALLFWSPPQVITDSWVELASTITLIAFVIGAYKHVECHVSGCHRLGRFVNGHYKLCHLHHPGVPNSGKITADEAAHPGSTNAHEQRPATDPSAPTPPPAAGAGPAEP